MAECCAAVGFKELFNGAKISGKFSVNLGRLPAMTCFELGEAHGLACFEVSETFDGFFQ